MSSDNLSQPTPRSEKPFVKFSKLLQGHIKMALQDPWKSFVNTGSTTAKMIAPLVMPTGSPPDAADSLVDLTSQTIYCAPYMIQQKVTHVFKYPLGILRKEKIVLEKIPEQQKTDPVIPQNSQDNRYTL